MTDKTQPTDAVAQPATDRETHFYLAGWNGARGNEDSHEHFRQALQASPPAQPMPREGATPAMDKWKLVDGDMREGENGIITYHAAAYAEGLEDATAPAQDVAVPIELQGVKEAVEQGSGFWRSCTGCHELNEGHATGPVSKVFGCALGNGCAECGGIGGVWDDTDYGAMADAMSAPAQEHATQLAAQGQEPAAWRKVERVYREYEGSAKEDTVGRLNTSYSSTKPLHATDWEPLYAAPAQAQEDAPAVLNDPWKRRMLDGRTLARDEMGCGEHPALPVLEEGMKPKQFFDALGIELAGVMAEDQMDMDAYDAMVEATDYNVWTPEAPAGDGWVLVAIFDTEDGPAAWWIREAAPEQPARRGRKTARDAALPGWWPDFIQSVAELPDRNSPEDEPEAMVATADELGTCAINAIDAARAAQGGA